MATKLYKIDGLVHQILSSSALTMEFCLSCTNQSRCIHISLVSSISKRFTDQTRYRTNSCKLWCRESYNRQILEFPWVVHGYGHAKAADSLSELIELPNNIEWFVFLFQGMTRSVTSLLIWLASCRLNVRNQTLTWNPLIYFSQKKINEWTTLSKCINVCRTLRLRPFCHLYNICWY